MKIIDAIWFTEMMSTTSLGIVKCENDVGEIKYYIGTGYGNDIDEDIYKIMQGGAKCHPALVGRFLGLTNEA